MKLVPTVSFLCINILNGEISKNLELMPRCQLHQKGSIRDIIYGEFSRYLGVPTADVGKDVDVGLCLRDCSQKTCHVSESMSTYCQTINHDISYPNFIYQEMYVFTDFRVGASETAVKLGEHFGRFFSLIET